MGLERFHALVARKVIRWMGSVLPVVFLLLCCTALANCPRAEYYKTDKGWFYALTKIEDADPATFHVLTGPDPYVEMIPCVHDSGYAVDRSHAYWDGNIIPGADPRTFSYLHFGYSRDANHVYYRAAILRGADIRTFSQIDHLYFKDATHVYLNGAAIPDADPTTFSLLGTTWWWWGGALARDARHVFFGAAPVPEASPKDTVDLSDSYWMSNQTIFFENKPLKQADVASFHVAPKDERAFWAEDKDHYFWDMQTLDKAECKKVGTVILACRNYVLASGSRVYGLDSRSLHYLGAFPRIRGCEIFEATEIYQDSHGIHILTSDGLERFAGSRQLPKVDSLDKALAKRLCVSGVE
jgi:hypothetical protein